jgi:hypothetical protein
LLPGTLRFRDLPPLLRYLIRLQALAFVAGGVLFLLAIRAKDEKLAFAAGLCGSVCSLACTAGGMALLLAEQVRCGPWPGALLILAGFNVLSMPLTVLAAMVDGFEYRNFTVFFFLCCFLSFVTAPFAVLCGTAAIFHRWVRNRNN